MDILPDLGSLSDAELKKLKQELEEQERELSFQRRMLHGKIDILRAEFLARLKQSGAEGIINHVDVEHLTEILTHKHAPRDE